MAGQALRCGGAGDLGVNVAGIDCGTNSIRLLIGEVDDAGVLHEQARVMRIVRLGEGVDRTGEFAHDALVRTFDACTEYAELINRAGASRVRFVATSASRDVRNRREFFDGVRERLGVEPEVITGVEEADLSFLGAIRGLPSGAVAFPALILDIGGGSTEFVLGSEQPTESISVDIGCVRLTERHLHGDPPTREQIAAVEQDLVTAMESARSVVPFERARSLVGLAGTVTTVAAMAMSLAEYDPVLLHGCVVSADQIEEVTAELLAMSRAKRAALPFMHRGRVDVIAGGAMVLRAAVRAIGLGQVVVSESDILDGILYRLHLLGEDPARV